MAKLADVPLILLLLLRVLLECCLAVLLWPLRLLLPRQTRSVRGELCVVTGAARGMGRLTALGLARLGAHVSVWDIDGEGAEETAVQAREFGVQARAYTVDCSRREDIQRAAQQVKRDMGEVSILVNNAGIVNVADLLSLEDHEIQRTFDVNILAHFWTVRAFLPSMLERNNGHIVTVASLCGHVGVPYLVDYSASKFAAVGFTEALSAELQLLGRGGVRTTCLCPYFVNTGFVQNIHSRLVDVLEPEEVVSRLLSAILAGETLVFVPPAMGHNRLNKLLLPTRALQAINSALQISFKTRPGWKSGGEPGVEPGVEPGAGRGAGH